MKTPPKIKIALLCQTAQQGSLQQLLFCAAASRSFCGGNTSLFCVASLIRTLPSVSDFHRISQIFCWLADWGILPFTADSELHSTLKLFSV